MKIRVIDKQTGQTGTLPEENFDPVKYTKIGDASVVAQKPTTLGNIPQIGPSDVLAQADIAKEKADKRSDTEKKIFQAAVVPAAQIIGGMTGGVVGAGLGGAAGEALRQWQGEEKADVGKVLKEGVIGAGTQYLGGKVGELLTKGKTAGKVAEEGTEAITKKPNIVEKAGTYVKEKASGINKLTKLKKTPTRAIGAAEVDDILKGYGLTESGTEAPVKMAQIYQSSLDDLTDAAASSLDKIDPTDVLSTFKSRVLMEVPELTKSEKAVQTLLENQIKAAKTVADLNAIDVSLRGTINKMTGTLSNKKSLYTTVQDTLRNAISEKLPQYKQSYQTMSDMWKVAPAIGASADDLVNGSLLKIGAGGVKVEAPGIVRNLGVKVGTGIEKLGAGLPSSTSGLGLPPMVGSAVAPAMLIGAAAMKQPPEVQATGGLGAIPQNEGAAVSGVTDITTPSIEGAATKTYVTGFSPEQLYQGYMKALTEGDKAAASQLKTMYSDEVAYQKTQGKAGGKTIPSTQVTELADMKTSLEMTKKMANDIGMGKGVFGPIIGRARSINPYDPTAQIFQSEVMSLAQNVGRALEGGVLRQEDVKKYLLILPKISDTKAVAKGKLENVTKMLENKLKLRQAELSESGYTQEGATTTELPSAIPVEEY